MKRLLLTLFCLAVVAVSIIAQREPVDSGNKYAACFFVKMTYTRDGKQSEYTRQYTDGRNIARSHLLNPQAEIIVDYPSDSMTNKNCAVKGFYVAALRDTINCQENHLSEQALERQARLKMGDKVSIGAIQATDKTGREITIDNLILYLR